MTSLLTPILEQNVGSIPIGDEDVEPDAQWKEEVRSRIEKELQSMADSVRQDKDGQLRGLQESSPEWETVMKNYRAAMDRVRRIAQEQFTQELKLARFERSLAMGKEVEDEEFDAIRRQQQVIWDTIKKGPSTTERPQGRRDSNVASNPSPENGNSVAGPPQPTGEQNATLYRDSRPLARAPPSGELRPRDRTQSGGSEHILLGTPGSYGTRPVRSRGNSSVSVFADFDPTASTAPPYDQGSIGRQGLSSLSKTKPQGIWLPSPKDLSRTFAHATAPTGSPVSPNMREGVVNNDNGRTLSRAGSIRSIERPSPATDSEPGSSLPRDRFGMSSLDDRYSRKGKEPEWSDHQRHPSFTQQTAVHDIFARRSETRTSTPAARPSVGSDDQYFSQISPVASRYRPDDDGGGIPIRSSRRSITSEQGSPENMRYGPPNQAVARQIPSKRSLGDFDIWPQPAPSSRPTAVPQYPSVGPTSSNRPIPSKSSIDDDPRRHSPSGAWYGSQSPPNPLPFSGYDIPFSSSPRYRHSSSPATSMSGRRNSNSSRSVRSRSSRQEIWGPSNVSQRPLATFEEQSVASDSDSEEDYGTDFERLWEIREHLDPWKLIRGETGRQEVLRKAEEARRLEEEARRKEEEARWKEEQARRKEEEARRKEEEVRLKALEIQQKQEELARREAELLRRETEAKLQEEIRKREEAEARLQEEIRKRQEAEEDARRRIAEEADRRAREEEDRVRRETREREMRERMEKEESERHAREDRERRDKEDRERRAKEEKEEREQRERERREKEDERREKQRRDKEEKEKIAREKKKLEREKEERELKEEEERKMEQERRSREQKEREEWLQRQREEEERFARERQEWEENRRRDAEAAAAAAAQAALETERLQAERLAAEEAEARRRQQEADAQRRRDGEARRQEAAAQRQRDAEGAEARRRQEAKARQTDLDATRPSQSDREVVSPSEDVASEFRDPQFLMDQQAEFDRIRMQQEEAAKKRAEATKMREDEESKRQAQFKREQDEISKRIQAEEQSRLKEQDARRRAEEIIRKKAELARQQEDAILADVLRRSEEEHLMREERRRRQDSVGSASDSNRSGVYHSSAFSSAPRPIPNPTPSFYANSAGAADRSSTTSSSSFGSSASFSASSGRSSATGYTSSTSRTPTASATPTPSSAAPSGPSSSAKGGWKPSPSPVKPSPSTPSPTTARSSAGGYHTAHGASNSNSYAQAAPTTARSPPSQATSTPLDENEWARRQEEHARRQFEQFQREQEAQQRRAEQKAFRQLSKEDVIKVFEEHERRWSRITSMDILSWHTFPWPMLKQPTDPEQLTYIEIQAYVLSPHHPGDKTQKERIKDYLRKWHPDRFETKVLPKVREEDREKVKEGAGAVARHLNKVLSSLSGSSENGLFG